MTLSPLKKVKDDDENDEKCQNPVPVSPELIHDVLAHLSKFVDYVDLKSMRLVDKTWDEASRPRLCRKSVILLKTGDKNKEQLENFASETEKLKGIKNIRIFIKNVAFPDEEEINLFNNILEIVSPSLESMEICRDRDGQRIALAQFFPVRPSIQFSVLSQLEIFNHEFGFEKSGIVSCKSIYKNAPNLKEINFQNFDKAFLEVLLNPDGSRNWELAPSLNAITFEWIDDDYENDLEIIDKIEYIASFPQTFTKLDIDCFSVHENNVNHLEKLLELNKNSLTNLRLTWFVGEGFDLKFPNIFPKLEKLELMFCSDFGFNIDIGKWSTTFPSLSNLAIDLDPEATAESLENVFRTVFPIQICRSLRLLELNFQFLYSKLLFNQGDEHYWKGYFKKMFPRAEFQDLSHFEIETG